MGDRPAARDCRGVRRVVGVAAVVVVAAALPSAARAHAFLISSDPPAGARLAASPSRLVLQFSEAYLRGTGHVSLRRGNGTEITLPAPTGGGTTMVQPLPSRLRGVFVVSWRVVSDDGHLSRGEFAFGVAAVGALPSVSASATPTPWSQVVASWLFFAGLAIAFGGLLSELLVWREARRRAPVAIGVAAATLASLALLVLLAGARVNGGFTAGLNADTLRAVLSTRPGALTLGIVAACLAAAAAIGLERVRPFALVPLATAAVLTSARGHSGTSGHWWAPVVDSVHLLAAAAWAGALLHLALVIVREPDRTTTAELAVRRYARPALPTVLVLLASGVLTAFAEFRSVGAAFHTSYGQTLIVKTALVLAALGAAAGSRLFAVRSNPGIRLPLLRRLTLAESAAVVAVLAAVGLLINLAPPRISSAAPSGAFTLGPPPLDGPAVRLSGFAGRTAVGLAATRNELQFIVMPPSGRAAGYRLSADVERSDGKSAGLFPRPCGDGCFAIRFALRPGTTRLTAEVVPPGALGAAVHFEIPSPIPADRRALLVRMTKAMDAVSRLDVTERLGAGPRQEAAATTYHLTGRGFIATEAFGSGAVDVRALGRIGGLTELTFSTRDAKTWYRLWLDGASRLRREEIVGSGALIRRTFRYPQTGSALPSVVSATSPVVERAIPRGPFVAAAEDGDLAVGFAAQPGGAGKLELTATVIGPDGTTANGLNVAVRLRSASRSDGHAEPCGPGCYAVTLPFSGTPRTALVTIRSLAHSPSVVRFDFPATWPPPSAKELAREATEVFTRLSSITIDERLGSSPTNIAHTLWRLEAPNRLTYAIEGGADAVVIGGRRWDRDPGGSWVESPQLAVKQPTPTWGAAPGRATLLGSARVDGQPVWRISFVQPDIPAWFTVAIDKRTLRTLELRMIAAAHFMHHDYGGFDESPSIRPPKRP